MIASNREVAYRVYGAWLLARFDSRGVQYFDESPQAALRSFYAALLTAPAFIVISLLSLSATGVKEGVPDIVVLIVHFLFYILLWVVTPVIMHLICQMIDRPEAFFRFLSANNWSSVITYHLNLVVVILVVGGVLPEGVAGLAIFAAYGYVLAFQWFLNLRCLDVSPLAAAGFVGLQLVLHILIESIALGFIVQPAS